MKAYFLNVIEPLRTSIPFESDCANNAVNYGRVIMHYHRFTDAILVCRVNGRDNTVCRFKLDKFDSFPIPDRYVKNKCSRCPYRGL